ncbi:recombinase family protein [Burkholderia ubonensis]|uniref:recombinase family protein n=1 Tax=Burkholderia ubonensis TaxID=101571 RepID=UPI0009B45F95|nr:recombinase family protein [Burkholderia ubonensis]
MKIGYARVSTEEQNLSLQMDSLSHAGCELFFTDSGISGSDFHRPGLDRALARLSSGDTLVVWRLDRLGRSLSKLVDLINHLSNRKIDFQSLTESINTSTAGGVLVFHMMAALAEFEQRLISERTRAGIAAARARGGQIGRKPALSPEQRDQALTLLKSHSINHVASKFNIHPRTLKRITHNQTSAIPEQSPASTSDYFD